MDIKESYSGFIKACEILSKLTDNDIYGSNGVFILKETGGLHIVTLHEKVEKLMIPFIATQFVFNAKLLMFMHKYFIDITDIKFTDDEVIFIYGQDYPLDMVNDKSFSDFVSYITEKDDNDNIIIKCPRSLDSKFKLLLDILAVINIHIDIDNKISVSLNTDEIISSETPIVLENGRFYTRICKSEFLSVTKKDSLTVDFIPYFNDDDTYVMVATVNKDKCQIINIYNMLYLNTDE